MLLSLPALSPAVPAEIAFGTHNPRHLHLALAMSRIGMIGEGALRPLRAARLNSTRLRRLIESVWEREIGPLFDFRLLTTDATLFVPNGNSDEEAFVASDGTPQCAVVFNARYPLWFAVGDTLERLEALQPGLGVQALGVMERVLALFCLPFTPWGVCEMASTLYWEGYEDEAEMRAHLEEAGEDDADLVTREDLFGEMPAWVPDAFFKAERYQAATPGALGLAAQYLADEPVAVLLGHLDRVEALCDERLAPLLPDPPEEYECMEPPAVLYWNEADQLHRVIDDWHAAYEGGEQAPYSLIVRFDLTPARLAQGLERVRHIGALLQAFDAALACFERNE